VTQFGAVLWAKGRIARHSIASIRDESWLKISVVGTAAIVLWLGALYGFAEGFLWLQREGFSDQPPDEAVSLAEILMARLLAIFALALFFMLIFSNVLIAFSTMYKAREVRYLLHAPLDMRTFYRGRLLECVSFSSWASAYLGSPMLLAYGLTTGAHWGYYLVVILFYLPFVTIPAALGSIVTMILVRVFPRLPRMALFALAAAVVVMLFLYLRDSLSAEQIADESLVSAVLEATTQTQSRLLPSYWASQGVLSAAKADYRTTAYLFGLLLSNAMLIVWLGAETAHWLFRQGFSALLGSDQNRARPLGKGLLGRLDRAIVFLREPSRSLVAKDIRLFWRDPTQWSQFVILFGIMAVYIANLGNRSLELSSPAYRSWVASLNSGACSLILASLTSRFVFPLISLEGFRFWILGLAPLTKRQLVRQKFGLSLVTTSPFTILLVVLSCYFLEVSALHFSVALYTIVLANIALAGLAVGLGALYPNFEEDNPARIVSGMGGTLNFVMSVGYITLVIGSQMAILQWHAMRDVTGDRYFATALTAVLLFNTALTFAAAYIPMRLGLRNLNATEF